MSGPPTSSRAWEDFLAGQGPLAERLRQEPPFEPPETLTQWFQATLQTQPSAPLATATPAAFEPPASLNTRVLEQIQRAQADQSPRRQAVLTEVLAGKDLEAVLGAPVPAEAAEWLRQTAQQEAAAPPQSAPTHRQPSPWARWSWLASGAVAGVLAVWLVKNPLTPERADTVALAPSAPVSSPVLDTAPFASQPTAPTTPPTVAAQSALRDASSTAVASKPMREPAPARALAQAEHQSLAAGAVSAASGQRRADPLAETHAPTALAPEKAEREVSAREKAPGAERLGMRGVEASLKAEVAPAPFAEPPQTVAAAAPVAPPTTLADKSAKVSPSPVSADVALRSETPMVSGALAANTAAQDRAAAKVAPPVIIDPLPDSTPSAIAHTLIHTAGVTHWTVYIPTQSPATTTWIRQVQEAATRAGKPLDLRLAVDPSIPEGQMRYVGSQ